MRFRCILFLNKKIILKKINNTTKKIILGHTNTEQKHPNFFQKFKFYQKNIKIFPPV